MKLHLLLIVVQRMDEEDEFPILPCSLPATSFIRRAVLQKTRMHGPPDAQQKTRTGRTRTISDTEVSLRLPCNQLTFVDGNTESSDL